MLLAIVVSILNIICFLFGFILGSKARLVKGDTNIPIDIKVPEINPINIYKEHKENKKQEEIQREFEINMHNIDVYDGTSNNQKDF